LLTLHPNQLRILGIVEKSPGGPCRKGPKEEQDWWRQIRTAAMYNIYPNTEVWCISATQLKESEPAVDYYDDAAVHSGIRLHTLKIGFETVSQLEAYAQLAHDRDADLVLFATKAHMWQVKWICEWKGIRAEFVESGGLQNPQERIRDPLKKVAYPLMLKLGVLDKFLAWVVERRKRGIL
jgi:hypothetical protein